MNKVIIDVVLCVVWLAACIFFIRLIPGKNIGKIIAAAILFILFTALSAGSSFGRILATKIIDQSIASVDESLAEKFPNSRLVRGGVPVSDSSKVVDELEAMGLTQLNTLGATGLIAKEAYKAVSKEIIKTVRTKTDTIVKYAEKDGSGKITTTTLLNIVKDQILNIVKWIVLVIHLIVWIFMAIHLCRLIFMARQKPQAA